MNTKMMKFVATTICFFTTTFASATPVCTLKIDAGPIQSMDQITIYSGSSVYSLQTMIVKNGDTGYGKSVSTDEVCVQVAGLLKGIESFKGFQGLCMPNWDQIQKEVSSYTEQYGGSNQWRNLVNCAARINKYTQPASK